MMAIITPGPWEVGVWEKHVWVHGGPNNDDIAEFNFADQVTVKISKDEAISNARLFCAAPELLAALRRARTFVKDDLDLRVSSFTVGGDLATLDETDGGMCGEAIEMLAVIDAAIAKAEGAE